MGAFERAVIQPSIYGAIRAGMILPNVAGLRASIETARAAARVFGSAPFNRKRVERACGHIAMALPDSTAEQRRDLALRSYEHLFMLGVEVAHAPRLLSENGWVDHVDLNNVSDGMIELLKGGPVILVTGHCGNWEVLGYTLAMLGFPMHVLYRPLDLKPLDNWVRETRARRGLTLIDKFGATEKLPGHLESGGAAAFVADQNAGDRGMFVPFFGRLASTYKSIGLMALRFNAPIICGQATRLPLIDVPGGMRYRLDLFDIIRPGDWADQPDPLFYITARYRHAIERMVLSTPEQYLWMHRIWKSRPRHERLDRPMPASLRDKIASLPWLDDGDVERIVDQSDRDRRFLTEHGLDRLP